jgi:hypothetical protein
VATEIFPMIEPVFDLALVADKYGVMVFIQDLPAVRIQILN